MSLLRLHVLAAASALLVAAACGGTKHIGEISPAVVDQYSGSWHFNAAESDSLPDPVGALGPEGLEPPGGAGGRGMPGGGAGRGGGAPGGRGVPPGGGMPGGGMPPGARGGAPGGDPGAGGRMNPEAMQAMRRVVMAVPTRIDMHLADSVVTVAYSADPEPYVLFFGKEAKRELGTGLLLKARADWKTDRIVVTRTIDGGGSLKESLVPSVDGQRLTVIVEMGRGAGQTVTFRRVYERGKPEAP